MIKRDVTNKKLNQLRKMFAIFIQSDAPKYFQLSTVTSFIYTNYKIFKCKQMSRQMYENKINL